MVAEIRHRQCATRCPRVRGAACPGDRDLSCFPAARCITLFPAVAGRAAGIGGFVATAGRLHPPGSRREVRGCEDARGGAGSSPRRLSPQAVCKRRIGRRLSRARQPEPGSERHEFLPAPNHLERRASAQLGAVRRLHPGQPSAKPKRGAIRHGPISTRCNSRAKRKYGRPMPTSSQPSRGINSPLPSSLRRSPDTTAR